MPAFLAPDRWSVLKESPTMDTDSRDPIEVDLMHDPDDAQIAYLIAYRCANCGRGLTGEDVYKIDDLCAACAADDAILAAPYGSLPFERPAAACWRCDAPIAADAFLCPACAAEARRAVEEEE